MPFKKHLSGYFSSYGLSKLTYSVSGCFLLKNEKGEVIYLDCSNNVPKTIKELYNSNHYVLRYKPEKYEIEDCCFKDINFRLKQLQCEIKTFIQSDFKYFD